ncbi:MAG: TraK family protein [Polyangiales bacterium]
MDERERSDLTGRLRKAAEKMPYPYFLLRLEDIETWLKAGYSVKGVWRIYCEKSVPFPGSYRSFLRYCRQHCESAPAARRRAPKAPEATPGRPVSVLGQGKRYPPPRTRPPGPTPEEVEALMDPERDLGAKR